MNFFQLECFKTAIENSSFVEAANRMHVTSPTITYQITNLEDELGEALFHRSPKGVAPTAAGKLFYDEAVKILAQYHSAILQFKKAVGNTEMVIRLGFTRPPDNYSFHALIHRYRAENPDIVIDIKEDMMLTPETAGDCDILFHAVYGAETFNEYEYLRLGSMPYYATVGEFSKWAACEELTLESLRGDKILVVEKFENTKYQVPSVRELQKYGIDVQSYNSLNAMMYAIADNLGVGIYATRNRSIQPGFKRVPMKDIPPLEYGILYRKKHSSAVEALLQFLLGELKKK